MIIRIFPLFALLLGFAYLYEGVRLISSFFSGALSPQQSVFISLDFLVGAAVSIVGLGLLFLKEWARKSWPVVMSFVALIHLAIIAITVFAGFRVNGSYFQWTGMIVVITAVSWWYFMKQSVRVRFSAHLERR